MQTLKKMQFLSTFSYVSVTEKSNTYDVSLPQASISKNNSGSLKQQQTIAFGNLVFYIHTP